MKEYPRPLWERAEGEGEFCRFTSKVNYVIMYCRKLTSQSGFIEICLQ